MRRKKKLPVGIENFEKLIRQDFYYVDKTEMIADLLYNWGEVNLFTRPRRFGKSLNMSMLKTFFEIGCDRTLFDGLKIAEEKELCDKYMGKFPVISITLKNAEGLTFAAARDSLKVTIGTEAKRFGFLLDSEKMTEEDRQSYRALVSVGEDGRFQMSDTALEKSLLCLAELLEKYYERPVILLVDEYDVPLDKAFQYGYYDEMVALIRAILGNALKTNPHLQFAVLTGCLRISKESVFTGLNNFMVFSVTNVEFDEYFGFTDADVKEMLAYYELSDYYDVMKEWYDGYQFGNVGVYCPWDVIRYCKALCANPMALPENYWSNTSGNGLVRRFIDMATMKTKDEMEHLIAGEMIVKEIRQELTYSELDTSIDNLWSILFTTGYLTQRGRVDEKRFYLAIPNREIRDLFISQIWEWFGEVTKRDPSKLDMFCDAFPAQDAEKIEELLNDYLWNTISIRDTAVANSRKENFYHGLLLGLLGYKENWLVKSNRESGEGYGDIMIEIPESRTGVIIEMKYALDGKLDQACEAALLQIRDRRCQEVLESDGMTNIVRYGIACYKKRCRVMVEI